MTVFECHSEKQEAALFSEKRITLCSTGIQWGKTTVGAVMLKMLIHENPWEDCNYIITAPNYKILQQATLPCFLRAMVGCGEYLKADAVFQMHSGAKIFCRTATDPDSIVGITNVYGIWGDEAGKYPYYFWVNIQGRSRFKKCPIILTTSLYSFNWVCKELIIKTEKGLRNDVHVCQAESRENPYFPLEEYEEAKRSMDPARFAMMYGGRPSKMEGMVYDCLEPKIHFCKPYELPSGTRVFAGIDWGFTQPFACIVIAKLPSGRYVVIDELVQARLTISDIVDRLKPLHRVWNIERFYAGPDQPASIKSLTMAGLPCSPANNDVCDGIDKVYSAVKTNMVQFWNESLPNLIDELESYHWPEPKDLKPDQDEKRQNPVKQDDHACDAMRYCFVSILPRRDKKIEMKVPDETKKQSESVEQRLKRLRKKRRTQYIA